MPQLKRTAMLLAVSALSLATAERAFAQADNTDEYVPGELLIGFDTPQEREALISRLDRTRQNMRAGGEAPAALVPERRSGATLKLKVEFPDTVQSRVRNNPSAELALLEQVAEQVKANNGVSYAHPNWIVRLDPNPLADPNQNNDSGSDTLASPQAGPGALPNDPFFKAGLQWHYQPNPKGMNAVAAWEAGITGSRDIVVAVLDTGESFDQEDVAGSRNVQKGYNFFSHNNCTGETPSRGPDATDTGDACPQKGNNNSSYHGTHVAGLIGGVNTNNGRGVSGVNWEVTIVPARVCGPGGCPTDDTADALMWAAGYDIDGIPRIPKRADVVNMSLGGRGPCDRNNYGYMIDAIQAARRAGVTIVVSAGNGTTLDPQGKHCTQTKENQQTCTFRQEDVKLYRPASCAGVIAVSAHDSDGVLAPYSNFGTSVAVMAPGGNGRKKIKLQWGKEEKEFPLGAWSTTQGKFYGSMNGTSQAAPHVAGAIALALSKKPAWRGKPDLIAQKLRASLVPPPADACPSGKPCGAGMLDVMKLLSQP